MKILVLTGNPHKNGTTALLADEFCLGAKEAGNEVIRFDTAGLNIKPCLGCGYCRIKDGCCVRDDDMKKITEELVSADAVAFVSPLYYFGVTAQLKTVIDRFYAVNPILRAKSKKVFLLSAGSDSDAWAMDGIKTHFSVLCRYLGWKEEGAVLALSSADRASLEKTEYKKQARELGRSAK